jgi:hypothetical protein
VPRKLKVFRTSTGFHDAYVAAPSRKAALAAWGADADLFARGVAELVTDPRLTEEPLEHPGQVIRRSRGDLAAQLKALGPRKTRSTGAAKAPAPRRPAARSAPPKRDRLDAAKAELDEARRRHAAEAGELEAEREGLERRLEALHARQRKELARLERRHAEARERYRVALEEWSG